MRAGASAILLQTDRLVFGLSLLGLAVSAYLAYEYSLPADISCPLGGGGCETVRQSAYSRFLGFSVPQLGIAYYLTMAVLSLLMIEGIKDRPVSRLRFLGGLAGVVFSGYLTILEALVIRAYCVWCLASATIATVIFILVVLVLKGKKVEG